MCYHPQMGRPRTKFKRICETCGKEFMTWPCKIVNSGGKFCSKACFGLSRRSGVGYVNSIKDGHKEALHRIIWKEANGPIPLGYHVHHINEDTQDNRLENLRLMTNSEHGRLHNTGEDNPRAALATEDILAIRARVANGERHQQLALEYGCSRATIGDIVSRKSWKHV